MLADLRSLLFVPADRPERYARALASGADAVCIDLEDAVAASARPAARACVVAHFLSTAESVGPLCGLRINGLASRDGLRDIVALQDAGLRPGFVMLAKCEGASDMRLLAAQMPGVPLVALVESVAGLQAAPAIAAAHPSVQALLFGGADFSAQARCAMNWEALLLARSTLAHAAAQAGIACLDVPFLDITDPAGAQTEAARAAALGYTGKALIHPAQVAPVHAGFAPPPDAVERARRIVEAASGVAGAVQLDGRMIDRPVVLGAQRLLRRAAVGGHDEAQESRSEHESPGARA